MAGNTKKKTKKIQENKDNRPRAVAKYIRISPFKVRAILDLIRGKDLTEALAIVENAPKSSSLPIKKALMSAAANAEYKAMNRADLFVAVCKADAGPTLKRVQPRAQGRAFSILKRTSHITVVLDIKVK